jgi:undecaprenyl-diphosphatase
LEALNRSVFLMINAGAPAPEMLLIATILAEWVVAGVPLLLAGLWLWGTREDRTTVIAATFTILLSLACNELIRVLWPHPRPFMIGLGHTFIKHLPEASFPSDHATVFFSLGLCLMQASLPKTGGLIILLGALVAWSRVYLGVHFPLDIVGAMLVALLNSWLVIRKLARRPLAERLLDLLESVYERVFALLIAKEWVRR